MQEIQQTQKNSHPNRTNIMNFYSNENTEDSQNKKQTYDCRKLFVRLLYELAESFFMHAFCMRKFCPHRRLLTFTFS